MFPGLTGAVHFAHGVIPRHRRRRWRRSRGPRPGWRRIAGLNTIGGARRGLELLHLLGGLRLMRRLERGQVFLPLHWVLRSLVLRHCFQPPSDQSRAGNVPSWPRRWP